MISKAQNVSRVLQRLPYTAMSNARNKASDEDLFPENPCRRLTTIQIRRNTCS